ncbi:MAG: ATP-binding protein [Desulfobacterales bacterium]|nr:ATP-binding protein [Desulfobacterales bacterium]MDD4072424.1 ATP-binding protein [Desulfobacterales bacterium]MDD4393805.1 ATP-binding protein [Desulfobacterales bacterium]
MKELVVISGKGGTGKTSVTAAFAALASHCVLADCDVDAADLHLILNPRVIHRRDFSGGKRAKIIQNECTACGLCQSICRFDAIQIHNEGTDAPIFTVDPIACEGCGVCAHFCPSKAIDFSPATNGQWFISDTRFGPMVHAKLGIAEENSGKLVALVRSEAKKISEQRFIDFILVDGPPGIGCPVIASISGAGLVLAVTEPTLSGLHDLNRIIKLAHHFQIPIMACVNKWDINEQLTMEIEKQARSQDVRVCQRIRYDPAVTQAQLETRSVVEFGNSPAAEDIKSLWHTVSERMNEL